MALLFSAATGRAVVYDLTTASGPFTLFSGSSNSTYFGWTTGTWDGNADPGADVVNGVPSINPGGLATPLLVQTGTNDIISSTNNIYGGVASINAAAMTLTIPTMGTAGTGFTTIVIQGNSMSGGMFGVEYLDVFAFGEINGVAPTYVFSGNTEDEGQWWAQWDLAGNASSYTVDIIGYDAGVGVLSVTDMTVNTIWSADGFAGVSAVPEPSTVAFLAFGSLGAVLFRRRRH